MIQLCVSGRIGAGKTVLCRRLAKEFDLSMVSFGDIIRREMTSALSTTPEYLKTNGRRLMQEWGNFRRAQDPSYWPEKVLRNIERAMITRFAGQPIHGGIIDSLRAPHEVEVLRQHGFKHIRLDVPDARRFEYLTAICGMDDELARAVMLDDSEHLLDDHRGAADCFVSPVVNDAATYALVSAFVDSL